MAELIIPIPAMADLDRGIKKTYLDMIFATDDNEAHQVNVQLYRGHHPVELSGAAVTAYFIRYSDNATISLTGEASGNTVSVKMKKSCYNRPGQFALIIKATVNGATTTVFYGEGTVFVSNTDTILDEENVIPSLDDLLAQIAVMESATNAANTATGNANNATANANNAAAKINGMTVSAASSTTAGATISEKNGVKHIAFKLPKGDKGDKGDPGTIENVTITSINGLSEALDAKLGKTETAANASKLGGVAASNYALKTDIPEESDVDLLTVYPVGSIYMSSNATSPASLFGGSWEQLKDRFLVGAGNSYSAGSTGGEATHTLTADEIAEHTHAGLHYAREDGGPISLYTPDGTYPEAFALTYTQRQNGDAPTPIYTGASGGGLPHNNMPPYLAIYMWKRVS